MCIKDFALIICKIRCLVDAIPKRNVNKTSILRHLNALRTFNLDFISIVRCFNAKDRKCDLCKGYFREFM